MHRYLICYELQAATSDQKSNKNQHYCSLLADHQHLIKTQELSAGYKECLHGHASSSLSLLLVDSAIEMLH